MPGRENRACKGPEAGACFVTMRNSEDTSVAGAGHGGKSGDEVGGSRNYMQVMQGRVLL